jgi:hypothetical protein
MKNSNDTISNQTRDLPACGAVPQPTASLRGVLDFKISLYRDVTLLRLATATVCFNHIKQGNLLLSLFLIIKVIF